MESQPIHYVYCLVDAPKNRFKLGRSSNELYALALEEFYCQQRSFQVGYVADYASAVTQVIATVYASLLVDKAEHDQHGIWLNLECFEAVRLALCYGEYLVPPGNLTYMAAEKEKERICAQLNKLLGLT